MFTNPPLNPLEHFVFIGVVLLGVKGIIVFVFNTVREFWKDRQGENT